MNYELRITELRITELRNHNKEQRNISDPEVNKEYMAFRLKGIKIDAYALSETSIKLASCKKST